eukprot:scaffold51780_cov50-Attheya_sp.AAC.3
MTERYSLRKRRQDRCSGVEDEDVFDCALENLLDEHEADGLRIRNKRHRPDTMLPRDGTPDAVASASASTSTESSPPIIIPLDYLPSSCVERIFEMLDSPRDVYNLAFTSKFLLSHVTPEIVIRSAVFENLGKRDARSQLRPPKVISSLMSQVKQKAIHVPSTLRLLRLLNARRCERGVACWGYDLEQQRSARPTCKSSGLSLCHNCIKSCTVIMPRWLTHFARDELRVATYEWNHVFQPSAHIFVGSGHEPSNIGPIINAWHLSRIESTYQTIEEQKNALQKLIASLYGEEDSQECIEFESEANRLVDIYEQAESDARERVETKRMREYEQWAIKRNSRIDKRIERMKKIVNQLHDMLEDTPMKDVALDCTWTDDSEDCLEFKCTFVRSFTTSILRAPASATQRSIGIAASNIRIRLLTIQSREDFFNFGFLDGCKSALKVSMKKFCVEYFSSPLKVLERTRADSCFLGLLQKKKYLKALVRILRCECIWDTSGPCAVIMSNALVSDDSNNPEDHRSLAKAVWCKVATDELPPSFEVTPAKFTRTFNRAVVEYMRIRSAARKYVSHSATLAWLDDEPVVPNLFSRQDAIDQAYSPKREKVRLYGSQWGIPPNIADLRPYDLLLNQDFDLLLQVHQHYYRRGRV